LRETFASRKAAHRPGMSAFTRSRPIRDNGRAPRRFPPDLHRRSFASQGMPLAKSLPCKEFSENRTESDYAARCKPSGLVCGTPLPRTSGEYRYSRYPMPKGAKNGDQDASPGRRCRLDRVASPNALSARLRQRPPKAVRRQSQRQQKKNLLLHARECEKANEQEASHHCALPRSILRHACHLVAGAKKTPGLRDVSPNPYSSGETQSSR